MFVLQNPVTGQSTKVDSVTRQATVDEIRLFAHLQFSLDSKTHAVRLFCRGKELVDGCTLFEYNIKDGDVIFVTPRMLTTSGATADAESMTPFRVDSVKQDDHAEDSSLFYKTGDKVDLQCAENGAWYEAVVSKITFASRDENQDTNNAKMLQDSLLYHCTFESYGKSTDVVGIGRLAPRMYRKIQFNAVQVDDEALVNYNVDSPGNLGDWYHSVVREKVKNRREVFLLCDLITCDGNILKSCKITKADEIYKFEKNLPRTERMIENPADYKLRITLQCCYCYDEKNVLCRYCRCVECESGQQDDKIVLCEECDEAYHIFCLDPPLLAIPDDDFYCPNCHNDTSKVVKVKLSSRQQNMPSMKKQCKRQWDSGQACKGLTKRCTKVDVDFFGPIPGVEVGTNWQFQLQLAEAGVHRMVVAGIHGSSKLGAFSIVSSGGYEDDADNGDELYYTGSGGRDLSGNKRTASQSKDQQFDRFNLALALNCSCKTDPKGGDAAKNWRKGKPVRVCRSYKGKSKFSPAAGYRYDGIYKVVKYWKETGRSGFSVFRYLLRRDDPAPAPWSQLGQKRLVELGLNKVIMKETIEIMEKEQEDGTKPLVKKLKYSLDKKVEKLIRSDQTNKRVWMECIEKCSLGQKNFVDSVEEAFTCAICRSLMVDPVTTSVCCHSFCHVCLTRSFKIQGPTCPTCRAQLSEGQTNSVNNKLSNALKAIFVGYNN